MSQQDDDGESPGSPKIQANPSPYLDALFSSSASGEVEALTAAIERLDTVNFADDDGWSPLHHSASMGHAACVSALIRSKADVSIGDAEGATPLHLAAAFGHADCVLLLSGAGCPMSQKDDDGWTPLHRCAAEGHIECVRALVRAGADISVRGPDNATAADLCKALGQSECEAVLKRASMTKRSMANSGVRRKAPPSAASLANMSVTVGGGGSGNDGAGGADGAEATVGAGGGGGGNRSRSGSDVGLHHQRPPTDAGRGPAALESTVEIRAATPQQLQAKLRALACTCGERGVVVKSAKVQPSGTLATVTMLIPKQNVLHHRPQSATTTSTSASGSKSKGHSAATVMTARAAASVGAGHGDWTADDISESAAFLTPLSTSRLSSESVTLYGDDDPTAASRTPPFLSWSEMDALDSDEEYDTDLL